YFRFREALEECQQEYDELVAGVFSTNLTDRSSSEDEAKHRAKRRKVDSSRGRGRPRKLEKSADDEALLNDNGSWLLSMRGRAGNSGVMQRFSDMLQESPQLHGADEDDEELETGLQAPSVVWAKIPGRGPSWTPAVLTHVLRGAASTAPYMVYFLEKEQLPVAHLRQSQSVWEDSHVVNNMCC
ncbi:hypothetical protein Pmar_PMAR008312, partial [Perkinsus marinus ATCC 50983]